MNVPMTNPVRFSFQKDARAWIKRKTKPGDEQNLHRTCGPAAEFDDGSKMWFVNGQCKGFQIVPRSQA